MKKAFLILFLSLSILGQAQSADAEQIDKIFKTALTEGKAYDWLNHLSNQIGGRLSGSVQAQQAVEYTRAQLDSLGLDRVWLQPVMVPKWVRGTPEFAYFETSPGLSTNVPVCALGGSVATPIGGLKAGLVEVKGLEDLKKMDPDKIKGKIVFFNRPMDPTLISTFDAYSGCVDQRYAGAAEAAKLGAVDGNLDGIRFP